MRKTITPNETLLLIRRIDSKYKPAWRYYSRDHMIALARYFLPHSSSKPVLGPTRPRIVKWYCPFASQADFPSGHRYCINVYTGCDHQCVYCYAAGYEPKTAHVKQLFKKLIQMDMEDLEEFDVPPAPIHLSNSTDPFQPLEKQHGHTKYALEQILAHRHRFTTIVILTKNPLLPIQLGYIDLFHRLNDYRPFKGFYADGRQYRSGLVIEVSLAFWRDATRKEYEESAPSVEERMKGIRVLREAGIPVVLRIDPLFPRSPLQQHPRKTLADFNLPEAQTIEDLESLVSFAGDMAVRHIVYSPAKIVMPKGRKLSQKLQALRSAYETVASPEKLIWRGNSWRLPPNIVESKIVKPFLQLCERYGVRSKYCKRNLIETP